MVKINNTDELGVYVYRRPSDGITITIVSNVYMTAMYGPRGRKFFPTLNRALMCAREHGFEDVSSFSFI